MIISGTPYDDNIIGSSGNDTLKGNDGNDYISGGSYHDIIEGNNGDDILDGGSGIDKIYGGSGNDTISGGTGLDTIYGGSGNDDISGDDGNDRLYGNSGDDTIRGGAGHDRIDGSDGHDIIYGDDGDDFIEGGSGIDKVYAGSGDDTISGGTGLDTIYGSSGNDTINGNDGNDRLYGNSGNDVIDGGTGNDVLDGGDGSDTIWGGTGSDTISLAYDNEQDYYYGGSGTDKTTGLSLSSSNVNINGAIVTVTDGSKTDQFINFEQIGGITVQYDSDTKTIVSLYDDIFDRQADLNGLQFYHNEVQNSGETLGGVALHFLYSSEYTSKNSGVYFGSLNTSDQISEMYEAILEKTISQSTLDHWVDEANSGTSMQEIAGNFIASSDFQNSQLAVDQWDFII